MAKLSWNDRTCAENVTGSAGQAKIKQQFGEPQRIYSVGLFTSMTPEFASGQICQMWVYPQRFSGTAFNAVDTLAFDQLRLFLNRLVPPDNRTPSANDFSRTDSAEMAIVKWQHRTCAGL